MFVFLGVLYSIKNLSDKQTLKEHIEKIINSNLSATKLLSNSFKNKLIKKNEEFSLYMKQKQAFTDSIKEDIDYQTFKSHYTDNHTYTKMKNIREIEEGEFKELERKIKKENFYKDFFSKKINFHEIINYFEYIDEKTEYITMHKTKGSSIDNVLIVLDEYLWNEYTFKTLFQKENNEKKSKNQKLFYVACSRAEKKLYCLRIVENEDEKRELLNFFPEASLI